MTRRAPYAAVVAECLGMTGPAEAAFRNRWRWSTLQKLDPELATLLQEQIDLYNHALVCGSDDEARTQAAAMVRGWRAACARLEAPLVADDAYFEGVDYRTGLHVVIGPCIGSMARAQVRDGHRVVHVTPDEVAKLVAGVNLIADAKYYFPDAEILTVEDGPR